MFPAWMTGGPRGRSATPADRLDFSPALLAEHCTTPVLLIHHERDLRCPPTNSDLYFALLKAAGRAPTEMLRLPTTAHNGASNLGNPGARVVENEALLEWLERHLGPLPPPATDPTEGEPSDDD
jgi:dipeptidyl aminopeptidase/acylaminoacyl peptidase